jgi:hypothetical protein
MSRTVTSTFASENRRRSSEGSPAGGSVILGPGLLVTSTRDQASRSTISARPWKTASSLVFPEASPFVFVRKRGGHRRGRGWKTAWAGTNTSSSATMSQASTQGSLPSGSAPRGRFRDRGSTAPPFAAISGYVPRLISWWCISAEYRSIPSITADTRASAGVAPFPLYTETAPSCAVGRMDEKTGIPTRSRFVMSATRVMPASGIFSETLARVSSGETARWVSSRYAFLQGEREILTPGHPPPSCSRPSGSPFSRGGPRP